MEGKEKMVKYNRRGRTFFLLSSSSVEKENEKQNSPPSPQLGSPRSSVCPPPRALDRLTDSMTGAKGRQYGSRARRSFAAFKSFEISSFLVVERDIYDAVGGRVVPCRGWVVCPHADISSESSDMRRPGASHNIV